VSFFGWGAAESAIREGKERVRGMEDSEEDGRKVAGQRETGFISWLRRCENAIPDLGGLNGLRKGRGCSGNLLSIKLKFWE
jgi:hypothetical protein